MEKIKLDKFYKDLVHESDTFHLDQLNIIVLHSNASNVNGSRASHTQPSSLYIGSHEVIVTRMYELVSKMRKKGNRERER